MSRYTVGGNRPELSIVVGWDKPLRSYFAQVWDGGSPGTGGLRLWIRAGPDRVSTPEERAELVAPYGDIPEDVSEHLDDEYDAATLRRLLTRGLFRAAVSNGPLPVRDCPTVSGPGPRPDGDGDEDGDGGEQTRRLIGSSVSRADQCHAGLGHMRGQPRPLGEQLGWRKIRAAAGTHLRRKYLAMIALVDWHLRVTIPPPVSCVATRSRSLEGLPTA